MKNEIRFQPTQNNGRFEIFLYAQQAASVSVGALWEDLGSLQGQQGLCWSDCKIGTGVRCEGYKCKHTQRK